MFRLIKHEEQNCKDTPIILNSYFKIEKDEPDDVVETSCYMNTMQLSKEFDIKNEICADPGLSYPDQDRIKIEHNTEEDWKEPVLSTSSMMVKADPDTHPDFIASVSRKVHECTECAFKTVNINRLKQHKAKHSDVAGERITIRCSYCNKTFTHKGSLDDHILKIHPDFIASVSRKVHACTECAVKTVNINRLKQHKAKHSDVAGERITIRCSYCNKTFTHKISLDDHILKIHPDFIASVSRKVHACTECAVKTVNINRLKQHKAKHSDVAGERITIRCSYCNKTFTHKISLDDHILKIHPDFIASVSRKVHACTECAVKTVNINRLKQHKAKHSDVAGERITIRCSYCNKTFTHKGSLDDHILKIHPDFIASVSRKVHACTECAVKTVNINRLKQHKAKHSDVADDHILKIHPDFIASVSRKVHACTECAVKTVNINRLKQHKAKHSDVAGERITIRCSYCNKTFTHKISLDDHILKIHPDFIASVSGKVHACTECAVKTVNINRLKQHKAKHSDVAGERITIRCSYCNKTFTHKISLDDHILKIHPDFIASVSRKVHACTECAVKTVNINRLKQHKAKHSDVAGERITIRCSYCNKTFTHKISLDDHILKIHPDFIASVSRKVHACTECAVKTVNINRLKQHKAKHSDVAGERITIRCSYCNKTFTHKISLDDHILKIHPDFIASVSRKVHACTECAVKTVNINRLKQHKAKHSDVAGERITIRCSYCNKTFTHKISLDDHILKIHPDFIASVSRKVHACTECAVKTVNINRLKQHKAKHSDVAGERITIRCSYCNKTFTHKISLDDHILKIHPDFIASSTRVQSVLFKTVNINRLKQHKAKHSDVAGERITIRCSYCNKTFTHKISLDDHILKIHPDFIASVSRKVHACTECAVKTVNINRLKQHKAKHSDVAGERITIRCSYCNKTFTHKISLDDHILKIHPDFIASVSRKVHACTECAVKTVNINRLKQHKAKHSDVADVKASVSRKVHECTECTFKTVKINRLKQHMAKHPDIAASVSRKVYECTECTYKTVRISRLKQHMAKHPDHLSVSRKVHECTKCTFETVRISRLKQQIMCKKIFVRKRTLDDHIVKIHLDFKACVSNKDITGDHITNRCIYCNKIFESKQSLDDHLVIRHPNFEASSFKSKLALEDHIVKKHPYYIESLSVKVHECRKCTYKTASASYLKRHIATNHPDIAASVSLSIHECTKCIYKTVRNSRLKQHIMVKHPDIAGDRITNNCTYCNKTFINKSSLDDHIIKAHPDFIASVRCKVHVCTKCTFKTVKPSHLKDHIKAKHPLYSW
nr:unnamed protein product [Callosobruchus analis]